jgi:hypothetical protein
MVVMMRRKLLTRGHRMDVNKEKTRCDRMSGMWDMKDKV